MNKKGAEMTIGTIVLIVLALIVLVVLVFGFSQGWTNLWHKVIGFGGGKVNVQTIVQSCTVACHTKNVHGWCSAKQVFFDEKKDAETLTCEQLAGKSVGLDPCNDIGPCKAVTPPDTAQPSAPEATA